MDFFNELFGSEFNELKNHAKVSKPIQFQIIATKFPLSFQKLISNIDRQKKKLSNIVLLKD